MSPAQSFPVTPEQRERLHREAAEARQKLGAIPKHSPAADAIRRNNPRSVEITTGGQGCWPLAAVLIVLIIAITVYKIVELVVS